MGSGIDWRLICPDCDRRTFHDETGDGAVECRACGSTAPLEARKSSSRQAEPNPDRKQVKMARYRSEGGAGDA